MIVSSTDYTTSLGALADPTRNAIIELLRTRDRCVCHFIDDLDLKQSVISHHLGVLRRAGIVDSYPHAQDRRWMYYRLNRDRLSKISASISWLASADDYDPTPMPCPIDLPELENA